MPKIASLVFQKTKVVGTGNAELISVAGFRTFANAFPDNDVTDPFYYTIRQGDGSYEEGLSYLDEDGFLVRDDDDKIIASSNGGNRVNFAVGTKDIVCDLPSSVQDKLNNLDDIIEDAITEQAHPAIERLAIEGTYPDRTLSFDAVVASMDMHKVLDHKFGTNTPPTGATRISNVSELALMYQPWENPSNAVVINKETQRYPKLFTDYPNSIKWNPDEAELNTYMESGAPTLPTTKPVANVNYSRTVNVQDASAAKIGTVVGFGAESAAQYHQLRTHSITNPGVGDVYSFGFVHKAGVENGGWSGTIAISSFASAGGDAAALAADLVAKINAHTTLQEYKVTAYKMPGVPGGFCLTFPRRSVNATPEFGGDGNSAGDVSWLTRNWSRTGTGTILDPQAVFGVNYVVAKSGNTLTLAAPVVLTTDSTLYFNPTRMLEVAVTGGNATYTTADATGLAVGACGQFSYQDNNPRRINSVDTVSVPNTFTLETSVFMQAGHWITILDLHKGILSANTTSDGNGNTVLTFAATPAGIRTGMIVSDYFSNPGEANDILPRVLSFDATTVTVSGSYSKSSGTTIMFHPFFVSGQFWSKYRMMPGADNNNIIAMELTAKFPDPSLVPAWPAWWLFTDANDPNPTPLLSGSSEIDQIDAFHYWNNASTARIIMNAVSNGVTLEAAPVKTNSTNNIYGNNLGIKERKIGFVWTRDRNYFYVDGVLMFARRATWNMHKRANMGINLAHGSIHTSFMSNGFYPVDFSQYPYTYKVKQLKIWTTPNSTPITAP